jgi:hypothetical protein
MTPQQRQRMETPEWKEWKRRHEEDKRQGRLVLIYLAVFLAIVFSVLAHGCATGEIKMKPVFRYADDSLPE